MTMDRCSGMLCVLVSLISVVYTRPATTAATQTFWGRFDGKCEHNGLYYVDENSFAFCFYGNSYMMPCAPGTRNSGYEVYMGEIGKKKSDLEFCNVNLVAYGYNQHPALQSIIYGRRLENTYYDTTLASNNYKDDPDYSGQLNTEVYYQLPGNDDYYVLPSNPGYYEQPANILAGNENDIRSFYVPEEDSEPRYSFNTKKVYQPKEQIYPIEVNIQPYNQRADTESRSDQNKEFYPSERRAREPIYRVESVHSSGETFGGENKERYDIDEGHGQDSVKVNTVAEGVKDFIHGINNRNRLLRSRKRNAEGNFKYIYPFPQTEAEESRLIQKANEEEKQDDFGQKVPHIALPDAIFLQPESKRPYISKKMLSKKTFSPSRFRPLYETQYSEKLKT